MLIRLIGIFFLCIAQPSLADFQSGQEEYDKGNFKRAYEIWFPLAQEGNPQAQNGIGILFDWAEGFPEDNEKAIKYYKLAAESGYAPAQYNLGTMFEYGEGTEENSVKAEKWYQLSATQGEISAQYALGELLRYQGRYLEAETFFKIAL